MKGLVPLENQSCFLSLYQACLLPSIRLVRWGGGGEREQGKEDNLFHKTDVVPHHGCILFLATLLLDNICKVIINFSYISQNLIEKAESDGGWGCWSGGWDLARWGSIIHGLQWLYRSQLLGLRRQVGELWTQPVDHLPWHLHCSISSFLPVRNQDASLLQLS